MSCFYASLYTRRFPVSLLAIERFYELQNTLPLEEVVCYVLTECCDRPEPTEEDVAYLLDRLVQLSQKPEPDTDKPKPPTTKKTLGTAYHEFIGNLPTDRTLLWMTGFDYDRAMHLYCKVDRDDVMQMVQDFHSVNLEENRSAFEAALYGNGGSYKDDEQGSAPEPGTVDISQSDASGMKLALREAFGM